MRRFAFIDVSNTKGMAKESLGFRIVWEKLIVMLKNEKWNCEKVFYYEGKFENKKFWNLHKKLEDLGYTVRSKVTFLQKNRVKKIKFTCEECRKENEFDSFPYKCGSCSKEKNIELNDGGIHPKANFDVEITVDALDIAGPGTQAIFFTGDGDFKVLADKLIERGSMVVFISTMKETILDKRKRFSTRLRELIAEEESLALKNNAKPRARFLEMDNIRKLIGEDIPQQEQQEQEKENAAKRDVSE